jgi:hypothetical protein
MKKAFRIITVSLAGLVTLMVVVYLVVWKSPPYYEVSMKYDSKDSVIPFKNYSTDHASPFIISSDKYVIFGAEHTRDCNHKEIEMIENEWNRLKPTIALVEGRLGFLLPGFMDPVENLGEGGKVKALAHRKGIPVLNWDLSKEVLAIELQSKFSPEQIALAQILNPYFGQVRFDKPESPENFVQEFLKRAKYSGQEKNFATVADVDRVWKKYFAGQKDWRETSDEIALPGYLSEMMSSSNDLRNRQLVAAVKELVKKGERVFVVCGSSHAVCVAPAFQHLDTQQTFKASWPFRPMLVERIIFSGKRKSG